MDGDLARNRNAFAACQSAILARAKNGGWSKAAALMRHAKIVAVLHLDPGCIDIDNASKKVQLDQLVLNKLPSKITSVAA